MITKKSPKVAKIFICVECAYKCFKPSDYNKHLSTAKHKMITNDNGKSPIVATLHICECGKKFKFPSGLSRHKHNCLIVKKSSSIEENTNEKPSIIDILSQNKELMNLLILQNQEHQKTIMELVPRIGNTTTNNNNQFNLHVFLNEDCKDAINFSDFIKQIQVSLTDLENQAENGYIKGITKLFIENLQGLGMNNRPIHCTDKKRKTLYIKENNEWDKEGSQDTLKKGIQEVTRMTFERLIKEQGIHSDEYDDADSEFSMKCISIQRNLTPNHPRENTISKVIDNITQNTGIL
jgi:hypothetical protein